MSFYQDTAAGHVRTTMVLAVPRSASSMLSRALSVSPDIDGHVFQPFYNEPKRTDDLERRIHAVRTQLGAPPDKPLRIVTKVMAESVSGQHFRHLRRHCEHIVVLLRDPQSQALSTYRALMDLPSGVSTNEAELARLKKLRLHDFKDILKPYIVTPWEHMRTHVAQLQSVDHLLDTTNQWCVVDGDVVRASASESMQYLCRRISLRYDPAMVHSWRNAGEKTVGLHEQHYPKSWLGRAQQSNRIRTPTAMTPRLEDFSPSVRAQVEANLATYVSILASNMQASPKPSQMRALIQGRFARTSPIACYSLAALLPDTQHHTRDHFLQHLQDSMPEYASSYAIIDATVAHLRGQGRIDMVTAPARHSTRQRGR